MAQPTATVTRKIQIQPNLDQRRAAYAWECVQGYNSDYTKLTKAAPALIMNNGLMQALAFYESKGKTHHAAFSKHLREWLVKRFDKRFASSSYTEVMQGLFNSQEPRFYQEATDETLALLRWIRQFAAAANG